MVEQASISTPDAGTLVKCPSIMKCRPRPLGKQSVICQDKCLHQIDEDVHLAFARDV
jgi:hypothetical protein